MKIKITVVNIVLLFPNAEIVKIDKERHGYDIELSNDIELKFNKKGAFMGMDD